MAINTKSNSVAVLNPADYDNQMAQLQAQMDALKNQKSEALNKQANQIGEAVEGFRVELGNMLGKEITMEDFAGFIRSKIKGTLGSIVNPNVERVNTRLSEDDKRKLHARLVARQLKLKEGHGLADQPSVIAAEFNVSVPSVNLYASKWNLTRNDPTYSVETHPDPISGKIPGAAQAPAPSPEAAPTS